VTLLQRTCSAITPACHDSARAAQACLDQKTKPRGSLGRLEEVATRLASMYRRADPELPAKAVVVMAADHGVAVEGVSAYPADVTGQMVRNFVAGGAAINVLARQHNARLIVVDMGVKAALDGPPEVRSRRLGAGTANFAHGPAMSRETAIRALEIGIGLAAELHQAECRLLAVGDMGIANTTAASAIAAAMLGLKSADVTGRGTGVDDARLRLKMAIIDQALEINKPDATDPLDVLAKVGGFEIAGLAGVMLGAAAHKVPVVLDGFITGAAALIAAGLCPVVREYLIASHRSAEPGHVFILRHLGLQPLFDLELRLGEGTGAVLALSLIESSLRILREMATFASAGVTDAEGG
jgi:nicotinate-nucleotide--dimethylbenzimidazole phosphoribosyltransferase